MKINFINILIIICLGTTQAQLKLKDVGAVVSAKFQDISTKEVLLSQNEQFRLIPASLTKVITTATALEMLGADYTYKTNVYIRGNIIKGKLRGDVNIQSSGDPTLGSKYFEKTNPAIIIKEIVESLKNVGINSIQGKVKIKSDSIPYSAPRLWEDMGNYYGASPQGFNWMDNTIEVALQSGKVGSRCKISSTYPNFAPYKIDCRVKAASHSKDSAYVYGLKEIDRWWIEGSIPSNRSQFKIKAAMPNAQQVFKHQLQEGLKEAGIIIENLEEFTHLNNDSKYQTILTIQSPPLAEIIKLINHKSNNLFADQLLLTLAKQIKGKSSWDNGNLVVKEFWQDKINFTQHYRLRDGSGLSPKNIFSAEGMVKLLMWMKTKSPNFEFFANSLAKGGESGTLKSVFKHPKVAGKVIGKSGSMEGVLGYCGYLKTISGKQAAFCLIANNYLAPTKQVRTSMDLAVTQLILEE